MNRKYTILLILGIVLSFFAGIGLQTRKISGAITWDIYNKNTDSLFQNLSEITQTENEKRIITGIIGIPWAEGDNDMVENNPEMPAKRMLRVCGEDSEIDAFVVTYYSPHVKGTGFSGVFRQYPSDGNGRMLSSSTSYIPGMIISTYVFAKSNADIDENSIVRKEIELTATVQRLLESLL